MTIEDVVHGIARANNEGLATFVTEIDGAEVAYRLFARVDGARLIIRTEIDTEGTRVEFDTPEIQSSVVFGLAPVRLAKGKATKKHRSEVAVDRAIDLPVEIDVPCEIDGKKGEAKLSGAFTFFLREWGVKELAFEPRMLVVSKALDKAIAPLGITKQTGGYVLEGELGVVPVIVPSAKADTLVLEIEKLVVERRKRPRRDPAYRLRSSSNKHPHGLQLAVRVFDFQPELVTGALLDILKSSTDPLVAAHAAYLAGERGLAALAGVLRRCALDPSEDTTVRMSCLWSIAKLGGEPIPQLADSESPEVAEQSLRVWAQLDRAGLVASDLPAAIEFVDKHPSLKQTVDDARDKIDLPAHSPRSLAVVGNTVLIGGWNALWSWSGGTDVTKIASAKTGFEAIATSDDGSVIAAVTSHSLVLLGKKPKTIEIEDGSIRPQVAVTPDGSLIATAFAAVSEWTPLGKRKGKEKPHEGFASVGYDATNRLYVEDGLLVVARDGRFAVANNDDLTLSPGKHVFDRVHDDRIISLAFSHDGQRLATGDMSGTIVLWSCNQTAPLKVLRTPDVRISGIAFCSNDTKLYSVSIDEQVLSVWTL